MKRKGFSAGVIGLALIAVVGAWGWVWFDKPILGDPGDPSQVARGERVYTDACASCHGAKLEGQPDWRSRRADGRLPAPPHDQSGHTWHHPDGVLFSIIKNGIAAHAPPGYESDMPAFGESLSDKDIWAVLAYIKGHWPAATRERQSHVTRQAQQSQGDQ